MEVWFGSYIHAAYSRILVWYMRLLLWPFGYSEWVSRMVQILDAVESATDVTTTLQSRKYSTRVMERTTYFTKAAENVTAK